MTDPAEVVTLGECLASFVATTPGSLADAHTFERHIAGAEANVSVGLARLGHSVAYIGRVGDDGFGTAIRRHLRGEGVDVRHLLSDPEATTGLMFRERRGLGRSTSPMPVAVRPDRALDPRTSSERSPPAPWTALGGST